MYTRTWIGKILYLIYLFTYSNIVSIYSVLHLFTIQHSKFLVSIGLGKKRPDFKDAFSADENLYVLKHCSKLKSVCSKFLVIMSLQLFFLYFFYILIKYLWVLNKTVFFNCLKQIKQLKHVRHEYDERVGCP
jgi:hypothetical protein